MNDTPDDPLALKTHLATIPQTCKTIGGITRPTIYELVARGELTRVHIGRRALITTESIEAYLQRLKAAAGAS